MRSYPGTDTGRIPASDTGNKTVSTAPQPGGKNANVKQVTEVVTLNKLTKGGTDGSATLVNGVTTSHVPPT